MSKRIKADGFDEGQLKSLIKQLTDRFAPVDEQIAFNRQHFHMDAAADPVISKPYDKCQKFQTDMPRRIHVQYKARLTENPIQINVEANGGGEPADRAASKLTMILQQGWDSAQDRMQSDIQGEVSSNQIIDKYAFLHWGRCDDIWPDLPEREYYDEETEDSEKSDDETKGKYREKWDIYQKRVADGHAKAGFPYFFEVNSPNTVRFTPDRSLANGMALVLVSRKIGLLEYVDKLRAEKGDPDDPVVSANQVDSSIPIYAERDAPDEWMPSAGTWGDDVMVHQLWTRDEVYEAVASSHKGVDNFQIVKSDKHKWTMPPFVLIPAIDNAGKDVAQRYEPALAGVYRIKPAYDRLVTLFMLIAEMIALPLYYYETKEGARWSGSEDGKQGSTQFFTRNSAMAQEVPNGYELKKVEFDLNPAFVELLNWMRDELAKSAPNTGDVEVSASTQPWAIRLQQAMANVEPGMLLKQQANGYQIAIRSVVKDMCLSPEEGGLKGPVAMYKEDGVNSKSLISIDAETLKGLKVDIKVDPTTAAERVTLIQLGKELLNDPLVPLTVRKFLIDFMGDQNPDETIAEYDAEQLFNTYFKPAVQRQVIAEAAGFDVLLSPDLQAVGMGGQPLGSQDVVGMENTMGTTTGNLPGLQGDGQTVMDLAGLRG